MGAQITTASDLISIIFVDQGHLNMHETKGFGSSTHSARHYLTFNLNMHFKPMTILYIWVWCKPYHDSQLHFNWSSLIDVDVYV